MDLTSLLGSMLSSNAVSGMSQATNTSNADVTNVLSAALPSLLSGALQQSQNQQTAQGFTQALTDHAQVDTDDLSSFMQNVDMKDGAKIIQHLLGNQTNQVEAQVAQQANVAPAKTNAILSAAAPLIMAMLGKALISNVTDSSKKKAKSKKEVQSVQATANSADVSNLLGSLLGAGSSSGSGVDLSDGLDIGDVIGLMGAASGSTTGKKKKQDNTLQTITTVANILGKLVK